MTVYTPPQPFEELDHTADTGVIVHGNSADETLARLVLAFSQLVTGGYVEPPTSLEHLAVKGDTPVDIAIDVLRELLFRFDCDEIVPASCEVLNFDRASATLSLGFAPLSNDACEHGTELKAVTFHEARFASQEDGEWIAQIIFDV